MIDARGKPIAVGDHVRVVRPDPDYGLACILASIDRTHKVTAIDGPHVYVQPHPDIPLMPAGPIPFDPEELAVVDGGAPA